MTEINNDSSRLFLAADVSDLASIMVRGAQKVRAEAERPGSNVKSMAFRLSGDLLALSSIALKLAKKLAEDVQ